MKLGTKAETLSRVHGKLSEALVLGQVVFTVRKWESDSARSILWNKIREEFGETLLIVRSSALNEDTLMSSQAGKYDSVGIISGFESFVQAVNKVIASFGNGNKEDQILMNWWLLTRNNLKIVQSFQ